jgi:transcriptional regulator with XRE-family HTH domain
MDTFKNRLLEAMAARDVTQAELAKMTGLSKPRISQYVNGIYEAKQDALNKLSQALYVNVAWLMGYDVPMDRSETLDSAAESGTILGRAAHDPDQIELLKNYQSLDAGNRDKLLQFSEALTLLP